MSLINDVLRDLERRKVGHAPRSQAPTPTTRPKPRRWPLWLLMAAIAGGVLHWTVGEHLPRPASGPTLVAMTAGNRPVSESVSQSAEKISSQAVGADQEPGPPDPVEATPEQVAAAATEQPPAAPGEAKEPPRGPRKTQRSNEAGDEQPREAPAPAASPNQQATKAAEEIARPTGRDAARSRSAQADIHIERAGAAEQPGQDLLDDARRAFARGHFGLAESRARQLVTDQPQLTEAHRLLARALLRQGRVASAVQGLESALEVAAAPDRLAALLGRVLIERGEIARARRILETHRPEALADPDYHLLLAATQRQIGDHEAAAETYRALGGIIPGNARVWIGLGASMESLERFDEAIAAYERALASQDPPAVRFARQRLEQLK